MSDRLRLEFDDIEGLKREAERRLRRGEAIVPGVTGLAAFMPCELEIHHPNGGEPLTVGATVMTSPDEQERDGSVRLMLDAELGERLDAFLSRAPSDAPPDDLPDLDELVPVSEERDEGDDDDTSDEESRAVAPALRLRKLKVQEQIKIARTSQSLTERTAVERILGRTGWEALLANRYVTIPEVARIARKGTVPRPIIEQIVAKQTWIRAGTIRRALLTNPKMTTEMINRVLRATPAHELKLIRKQTAYPPAVRAAAKRLFGRGS